MSRTKTKNHETVGNRTQIEKLTPRHYAILDLCILGRNTEEISSELSMSKTQVNLVISSPCFKHQFGMRRAIHEEKISDMAVKELDITKAKLVDSTLAAAETLVSGLSSIDEKIKIKSASEILDRTGYPKETKLEGGTNAVIVINNKDLNILAETLTMVNSETQESQFKFTGH